MPITLLVADDFAMMREGLRALLEAHSDFCVIGEAANGCEAVRLIEKLRPNVAILKNSLPKLSGIDSAGEIRETVPETAVVILSVFSSDEQTFRALRLGVRGYLLVESGSAKLVKAVRAVHAGQRILDEKITRLPIE